MNLIHVVVLSLVAAGEPGPLPPGHPALPPNHPPLSGQPIPAQGELPPNYPPLTGQGMSPQGTPAPGAPAEGQLPPNHPPLAASGTVGNHPAGSVPNADELLKKLEQAKDLKDRDKTFEVAAAIGKLYYGGARYTDAINFFRQGLAKAEGARKLYLEQHKKARAAKKELPPPESAGCAPAADQTLDKLVQKAQEKAKAGDAAAAAACARVALTPVLEAELLLGKALFLSGDSKGAVASFARVLEVNEGDGDALYARGNTLLDSQGDDLKALEQAKKDFAAVAKAAQGPRAAQAKRLVAQVEAAEGAGGLSKLNAKKAAERKAHPVQVAAAPRPPMMGGMGNAPFAGGSNAAPPALTKEQMEAVQNTERTPELEQGLAKLVEEGEEHLSKGRYQEALDVYKRVVPFQPENGRAKAGMAWALVGLNRQPMADRIWGVAVSADAKAVDDLGNTLKAKGDEKGAKALWTKLASTAPDYARSAGLDAKLK